MLGSGLYSEITLGTNRVEIGYDLLLFTTNGGFVWWFVRLVYTVEEWVGECV